MSTRMAVTHPGKPFTLLSASIAASAVFKAGTVFSGLAGTRAMALESFFDYKASGTTVEGYVQTQIDSGSSWVDIAAFVYSAASGYKVFSLDDTAVTTVYTPTSGGLSANVAKNGIFGHSFRVEYRSFGDHGSGLKFTILAVARG